MEEIRCGSCRALLFKAGEAALQGPLEIKCRRCGTVNHLRPTRPPTERPRASSEEDTRGKKEE
ncbi:MAG: Com family DNA-binding transcriptional regulator [SAR324 cluster bacterium]|nr:Com family DNA-binding transcriptional regulator [SAR324 cluster bacterium]